MANYKQCRNSYLNCEKAIFEGTGAFGVPAIAPIRLTPEIETAECIRFSDCLKCEKADQRIVHFYSDDYRWDRVWRTPDRYLDILRKYAAVLQPDFSIYIDFPVAVNIFNHYRKQWLSAYWQLHGIQVIPSVQWGEEDTFSWCFDGVPRHSLIAVSTKGGFKERGLKTLWLDGFNAMLERVQPSAILLFGELRPEIKPNVPILVKRDIIIERKRAYGKRPQQAR